MTRKAAQHPCFLKIKEVALELSLCTKSVRRLIDAGELHHHRIGKQIRVSREDLLAFVAARRH
jgi:excisionase family DNA binding protein